MASIQERLQISRGFVDKWSTREQLCLASAVACSGDQNWMSVSRSLKIVCGSSNDSFDSRPVDWFSQKNCAVQYDYMLEEVETPRRKRASESTLSTSPTTLEAATEIILRRLTEERMQEIKAELRKEQEEYAKLYNEIKSIQNGELQEEQLLQMWNELEKEQEKQRIEEMKFENQLRERELKKQEQQRSWRTGSVAHSSSSSTNSLKSTTDTTAVDMDVEEIIGCGKAIVPSTASNAVQIQTGTSPLLSSLLKSPTAATPGPNIIVTSPSVRNTAPTITTLLTGGSIPNQNQPALIPSHDDAVQLLTRPLSGPPLDTIANPVSGVQTLLSPSQSAPTLSMLLEKNKASALNTTEPKTKDFVLTNAKLVENKPVEDCNSESVPMDIEENVIETKTESNLQSDEIDETDPNEEQQLLEVFKNIGNIEELDIDVSDVIDEEVDFLKGVDEETPLDENVDIDQKLDVNFTDLEGNIKLLTREVAEAANPSRNEYEKELSSEKMVNENNPGNDVNKIEIISSDDSNDNIPLAAVASLESSKDRLNTNESSNEETFLKDQVESANIKNELDQVVTANDSSNNSGVVKKELLEEDDKLNQEYLEAGDKDRTQLDTSVNKEDIFIAPLVEESKQEKNLKLEKEEPCDRQQIKIEEKYDNETNDPFIFTETESSEQQTSSTSNLEPQTEHIDTSATAKLQPPPLISIADTDENSSSTDISVQTRRDDKLGGKAPRKSPNETKTDDEVQNPSKQQMVTPNLSSSCGNLTPRPTALRKLRDRDRSESPMIDDDTTMHSDHSTTNQRSRRRYSSTPVIDSIPNSPASSDRDERELRTSKKGLLSVYSVLLSSKYSATLQRILSEESSAQKLNETCLRPIDFLTIKKNIDSGIIRTVYELQRDILCMCQNALMVTKSSSASFKTILQFQQECQHIREFMSNGCEVGHKFDRDNKLSSLSSSVNISKGRSGSRKSLRLS